MSIEKRNKVTIKRICDHSRQPSIFQWQCGDTFFFLENSQSKLHSDISAAKVAYQHESNEQNTLQFNIMHFVFYFYQNLSKSLFFCCWSNCLKWNKHVYFIWSCQRSGNASKANQEWRLWRIKKSIFSNVNLRNLDGS